MFSQVEVILTTYPLKGKKLLVALSGGPDSMALFYSLLHFSSKMDFQLGVAHVNHHLREEADEDAQFCKSHAEKGGIPFFLLSVEAQKVPPRVSPEAWARQLRYEALERCLAEEGYDLLALGHTADDQVETFFLRLLRGAGLRGLGGMKILDGKRFRPLLKVYRKDILAFLAMHAIPYREDKTNRDTRFLRNRLRQELIPYLESYQPKLRSKIFTLMEVLQEEEKELTERARENFQRIIQKNPWDWQIHLPALRKLTPAMQRRVLLGFLRELGEEDDLTWQKVETFRAFILSPSQKLRFWQEKSLYLYKKCDTMFVGKKEPWKSPIPLSLPGVTKLPKPWGSLYATKGQKDEGLFSCAIPDMGGSWEVRRFKGGEKTWENAPLIKVFQSLHLPPHLRRLWPLVTYENRVVWIPGLWKTTWLERKYYTLRWNHEESDTV